MNYNIQYNLLRVRGAFTMNVHGKNEKKPCICIQMDSPDLYVGEDGIYLNGTAFEYQTPMYGRSHYIRPDIPKEQREAMTEEQKKAIPFLGHMKPVQRQVAAQTAEQPVYMPDENEDLPF